MLLSNFIAVPQILFSFVIALTVHKRVNVTLDTDEECFYVHFIQTYNWKENVAALMLPWYKRLLQRTKTLILKPGERFT